jgi:hypothetical protein
MTQAQALWTARIEADNDAFDFWRIPGQRSDDQYTSGVRLVFEASRAPWWGHHVARRLAPCTGFESAERACLSSSITLGQDMYTPRLDREPYRIPDWENERPFAGWLYLSGAARIVSEYEKRTLDVAIGVTGPPSMAELSQTLAHALSGVYTEPPKGWETQVGFEPGVIVGAEESRLLTARIGGKRVFDVAPYAGVMLGNIYTKASAGLRSRIGWNMSHPWRPEGSHPKGGFELYATAGARGDYVARDISLDGNSAHPTRRVERVPWVSEYEFGAGAKRQAFFAAFRAVTRSREYLTGPRAHTYSSLAIGIQMIPAHRPAPLPHPVRDDGNTEAPSKDPAKP